MPGSLTPLGGLAIVVSVMGILVFTLSEAWPLFLPARGGLAGTLALPAAPAATGPAVAPAAAAPPAVSPSPAAAAPVFPPGVVQAMGTDEYQMYLYAVRGAPRIELVRLPDGPWVRAYPLAALQGATVTAASRSLHGDFVAMGTADGRVGLAQVLFTPRYEG